MARGKKYSDEIKERAFALLATSNNVQVVADTLGLPYNTVKTWEKKFLMRNSECEMRNNDGEFVKVRDENAGAQARDLKTGNEVGFVNDEVYEAEKRNDYSSTAKNGKKLSTSEFCEAKLDKAQEKSTSNSNAGACSVPRLAEARSRSEENDTQSFSNIRTPLRYLTREGDEAHDEGTDVSALSELRKRRKAEFVDRAWKMLERSQILLERRINRAYEQEDKIDAIIRLIGERGGADKLTQTDRNELYKVLGEIKLESTRSLSTLLGTLYDKQALAAKEPTVNVGGVLKFEDL